MTGTQLKAGRKRVRISQHALAKASKVSRYKISMAENGYSKLTAEESAKIEKVFKERCP